MGQNKRIGMVVVGHPVFRQPCLINTVVALRREGYQVDLITAYGEEFPEHDFRDDGVSTFTYRWGQPSGFLGRIAKRVGFIALALKVSWGKRYTCLIGVDPGGLIVASLIGAILRVPTIYYSLELYMSGDNHGIKFRFKKMLERLCNQRAVSTIVQDESRGPCLVTDNQIDRAQILIVPNSPMGEPRITQRDWWHRRFGLRPEQRVILQAGGITEWSLSYELAEAALKWPDDWALILHGYGRSDYLARIQEIVAKSNRRVFLSREMVPYSQLDNLIASADIGIALYRNVDQNFFHMASGKVTHYLRCGLPVVAQNFPNLRSLLHDNRCGICVAHPAEVRDAIEYILLNYEEFSRNAIRCYVEKLEFGKHFQQVLKKIAELS